MGFKKDAVKKYDSKTFKAIVMDKLSQIAKIEQELRVMSEMKEVIENGMENKNST